MVSANRLECKCDSEVVNKKGMSRLYFVRKLSFFNVCTKMVVICNQCVAASTVWTAVVCCGSSIGASDTNRLNKIIRLVWECGGEENGTKC